MLRFWFTGHTSYPSPIDPRVVNDPEHHENHCCSAFPLVILKTPIIMTLPQHYIVLHNDSDLTSCHPEASHTSTTQ